MNWVIAVLPLMSVLSPVLSEVCKQDGLCSCRVSGGYVDLSKLATPNPR